MKINFKNIKKSENKFKNIIFLNSENKFKNIKIIF